MHCSCLLILTLLLLTSSTALREQRGESSVHVLLVAFNAYVSVYAFFRSSAALCVSFLCRSAFSATSLRGVVALFSSSGICRKTKMRAMVNLNP